MSVRSYKDLDVWKRGVTFVTQIYACTKSFPREEIYGITSQIRRSAVSIPSNIAEGHAKRSTWDFIRFLNIAYGSIAELETQIIIACNLGYLSEAEKLKILTECSELGRMINGLVNALEVKLSSLTPES